MGSDDKKEVNGTTEDRGCTDIICCILFVAGFVAMVVLAIMGFANGDPWALTSVFDASGRCCGNVCGSHVEMEDYGLLYFPVPDTDFMYDYNICVKSCPDISYDDNPANYEYNMECIGNGTDNEKVDNCPSN